MKLAIFDNNRLGIIRQVDGEDVVVDVTDVLPHERDTDPLTAGWWRALCRDSSAALPALSAAAATGSGVPVGQVKLKAPVLSPSKVIAVASNYADHVEEMHVVQQRTLGGVQSWMMEFGVFLKAPSSIIGPGGTVVIPRAITAAGHEVHHESELVIVIGSGGSMIRAESALDAVFGFTAGLDITVRSPGDRSQRKSYDTFSPLGPFVVTTDELGDASDLHVLLTCDGQVRQSVNTRDMLTPVREIVAYASTVMTLMPGDLIFTGAPPGVGPISAGQSLTMSITGIGSMGITVADQ